MSTATTTASQTSDLQRRYNEVKFKAMMRFGKVMNDLGVPPQKVMRVQKALDVPGRLEPLVKASPWKLLGGAFALGALLGARPRTVAGAALLVMGGRELLRSYDAALAAPAKSAEKAEKADKPEKGDKAEGHGTAKTAKAAKAV